jgi:predicted HTH domain antitoxin
VRKLFEDQMNHLSLELPPNISKDEARLFLAAKLYEVGKLSLGKAAELSGHSKGTFIELISKMDIAVINYPADDLERELEL